MKQIDLIDLLMYIKSKILIIILIFVLSFLLLFFTIGQKVTGVQYTSEIKFIVDFEKGNAEEVIYYNPINNDIKNTLIEIMKSKYIIDKVIEDMEFDLEYENIVDKFSFEILNGSNVVSVQYNGDDKKESIATLNSLIDAFNNNLNEYYDEYSIKIIDDVHISKNVTNDENSKIKVTLFLSMLITGVLTLAHYFYKTIFKNLIKIKKGN